MPFRFVCQYDSMYYLDFMTILMKMFSLSHFWWMCQIHKMMSWWIFLILCFFFACALLKSHKIGMWISLFCLWILFLLSVCCWFFQLLPLFFFGLEARFGINRVRRNVKITIKNGIFKIFRKEVRKCAQLAN